MQTFKIDHMNEPPIYQNLVTNCYGRVLVNSDLLIHSYSYYINLC